MTPHSPTPPEPPKPPTPQPPRDGRPPATAVLAGLDAIGSWQEDLYRDLHAHQELSFQEDRTRAIIREHLTQFGFEVHELGGGIVGVLVNDDGPTVLFRADIDALPVTETTGLGYASTATSIDADGATVGVMHACGHDGHIACALGAARLLAAARDAWSGTYLALFQPAEEIGRGAAAMVDAGLVDAVPRPTSA
ncbi:M20/M25/M40 family metallo-hydrolase [Piscicoccus intestinalis]|uniref:M20/M25/M40 family metallo-hydrolase n=1 Tax=Piscicoccus intestinalis TaxID=746033 RepID=UPI000ADBB3DC|nr:M20/M25/M40 family metallo-hydrolase [Piscicoccus intestinalis]